MQLMIENVKLLQNHLKYALMAENACSMGFKSGEYGEKNMSLKSSKY